MTDVHRRNVGVAMTALLASSATLVCCVLPAVLVSLGLGATLVGLISAVPQLVWLSEHKAWIFAIAGLLLIVAGIVMWNGRSLPCPVDAAAARACMRLRSISNWMYGIAASAFAIGALFAFGLPLVL